MKKALIIIVCLLTFIFVPTGILLAQPPPPPPKPIPLDGGVIGLLVSGVIMALSKFIKRNKIKEL